MEKLRAKIMKIDIVSQHSRQNALKNMQDRFGQNALILNRIQHNSNEFIIVCHDGIKTDLCGNNSLNEIKSDSGKETKSPKKEENIFIFYIKSFLDELPLNKYFKNIILSFLNEPKSIDESINQIREGLTTTITKPEAFSLDADIYLIFGNVTDKNNITEKLSEKISQSPNKQIIILEKHANEIIEYKARPNAVSKIQKSLSLSDYQFDCERYTYILDIKYEEDILDTNKALSPKLETQRILVLPAAADYGHLMYFYDQASWDSIILSNIESGYFSWSLAQFLFQSKFTPYLGSLSSNKKQDLLIIENSYYAENICNLLRDHFS